MKRATKVLGVSRTSYYRHVRGMRDYRPQPRESVSDRYRETLRGVALRRPEAGHRKIQAYALAWQEIAPGARGSSRMSCYRQLKAQGLLQRGNPGRHLREIRERRRQMLEVPTELNAVLQGDFTDYETENGERYHIGCFTEYISRFNLVSRVLDRETAIDLIEITEAALKEIVLQGHALPAQVIVVTDNGPAMKAKEYRSFVKKTGLVVHVRGQKYHPQTIGREERYHGSLKLEHLYRVLPKDRAELVREVEKYRSFYNHERLHMSLGYRTPAAVYLHNVQPNSSYYPAG